MAHGNAHEIASGLEMEIGRELAPILKSRPTSNVGLPSIKGHPVAEEIRAELAAVLEKCPQLGQSAMCIASGSGQRRTVWSSTIIAGEPGVSVGKCMTPSTNSTGKCAAPFQSSSESSPRRALHT